MSQLRDFLVALASDPDLRSRYHDNPEDVLNEQRSLGRLSDDLYFWFDGLRKQNFEPIEITYEFKVDLDTQVADPEVVVTLKPKPGPNPPPVWSPGG